MSTCTTIFKLPKFVISNYCCSALRTSLNEGMTKLQNNGKITIASPKYSIDFKYCPYCGMPIELIENENDS